MRLLSALLLITTLSSFAQNLHSGGALKPEQAIMDIRHYTIALNVDPVQQSIKGYTTVTMKLTSPSPVIVLDFWHGLTTEKVTVNNKAATFDHGDNDILTIKGKKDFAVGTYDVKVFYGGKPSVASRPPWTGGFQWSADSQGNPWIAITCQGEGGKIYFPCKDHPSDEPNEGADMIITVPKGLTVAAPGLLKKVKDNEVAKGTTTFHWSTQYTISNYCLVFNAGKYRKVSRNYTTVDKHKVPLDLYILEEHAANADRLLDFVERSCGVLEKYFGEYPWVKEKIGVAETPHLGMEHQTMIAYGNKFNFTQLGGKDFDWLMHHEFGHEWWANKVTNRDWAHMWIQEGICSFGDALFTLEMEGEESFLRKMRQTGRNTQNLKPIVQGEVMDSDQAYTADIYGKGAFFMHTLRYVLGDSIFFPTLKKLATDPKYTYDNTVVTDDVERLFSSESGKDLKPLFDFYLRTINKLEIDVKQTSETNYTVRFLNYEGTLPMDVEVDGKVERKDVNGTGVVIQSQKGYPGIDPKGYYLKKVVLE
ncbi:MAG TPA: M1 family metallopeptidase [Cyclobacteriaceae bacterium]|nr:M1 family metallopeptidase [Cyclobacteriaceae bacterium]